MKNLLEEMKNKCVSDEALKVCLIFVRIPNEHVAHMHECSRCYNFCCL